MKIELVRKVDCIKNDWWVWECIALFPDGSEKEGFVQADGGEGGLIAEESFEEA